MKNKRGYSTLGVAKITIIINYNLGYRYITPAAVLYDSVTQLINNNNKSGIMTPPSHAYPAVGILPVHAKLDN